MNYFWIVLVLGGINFGGMFWLLKTMQEEDTWNVVKALLWDGFKVKHLFLILLLPALVALYALIGLVYGIAFSYVIIMENKFMNKRIF